LERQIREQTIDVRMSEEAPLEALPLARIETKPAIGRVAYHQIKQLWWWASLEAIANGNENW